MTDDRQLFRCLHFVLGVTAAALVLMLTPAAQAQPYTWDTVDPAYEKGSFVSANKGLKLQVLMGNARLTSNRAAFEDWYRKYLFPAMGSQDRLGELYSLRESLEKDLAQASDGTTHQLLLDLAYDEAVKRATGNYHPKVRFNSLLIIGKMNQVEYRRAERLPPIRLPKAFDFLLSELKKTDQTDLLKLAAMAGIERHLHMVSESPQDQPIPDGKKAEVAAFFKTMAEEKTVPDGRMESVHTWMRGRALQMLAALGQVGDGQAVFNSMIAIANDLEEPLSLRCVAARAIGDLDYNGVTGIDPVGTAHKLGALVAFACREEETWVKEQQKKLEESSKKPGGGYPGMDGGSGGGGYPGMDGGGGYPGMDGGGGYGMEEGGGYGMEGGGGYGMDGGSGGYGMPAPKKSTEADRLIENFRRRLKRPIFFAQLGIRGEPKRSYGTTGSEVVLGSVTQLAADETQKGEIDKILLVLDELLDATDYTEEGIEELIEQVQAKARALEEILPESAIASEDEAADNSDLPGSDLPGGAEPADVPGKKG